jgi:biopolymer transport protein ExbD
MAIKSGGFERKSRASDKIPDSSLADIAFLLLIFFMVTTVFRTDKDRDIEWPEAEADGEDRREGQEHPEHLGAA